MSANGLGQERCFNHHQREAVARCPECGRYFCRECVTEHDGRMLCTGCLATGGDGSPRKMRWLAGVANVCWGLAGILILWTAFYYLGQALLWLPDAFHEGTLWENRW